MPINVTLGTNDLEISDANGDLIDTIAYQSIDTIAYVNNPGTVVNSSTLGAAPTVTGDPQWSAVIWLRDGRKAVIMLGDVDNQAGWTNDQTGFDALVADIYAAFPAGGGGGGTGTVTSINVSGGTTGYSFTGGPVTGSGTITMTGSAAIPTGNTLWVDIVYGDDGTGTANRQDLPYATIMAALADAGEGDSIVVRPGSTGEDVTDADAPQTVYINLMPGAAINSLTVTQSVGWSLTGGGVGGNVVMDPTSGYNLILQTVTIGGNMSCISFGSIQARECLIKGDCEASDAGTFEVRNCQILGVTSVDASSATSYSSHHFGDANIINGGNLYGEGSVLGGPVTADPVAGDFYDGVTGADGDTQVLGADGRWGWQPPAASVAIVSGGALVRQNNAVIVPFPSLINEGGAGDGGRCVRYLTDDGTSTGTPLFSSIIGWPTAVIQSAGSSGDPSPMYIVILELVSGANRVDFFATSPDGTVAPNNTPLMIWVTGIPA